MHNKLLMHLMLHNKLLFLLFISFQLSLGTSMPRLMTHAATYIDDYTQEISIAFTVAHSDLIYKDFITISTHEPNVTLSEWKTNKPSVALYDPLFKETKQVFNEDFTLTIIAQAQAAITEPAYLYCSYYRQSDKKINQTLIPLLFTTRIPLDEQSDETTIDVPTTNNKQKKSDYLSPTIN